MAVCGVPQSPGTYYMGATGGGVWKTSDYGQSWQNISDGFFASPSIGSIAVAQADPARVVVGTGSDGIRSNVIAGKGVYRSDDAGASWTFLGLEDAGQIGAVLIDPQNSDRIFVAALGHAFGPNPMRGVFRTSNGGKTWDHVLFFSDTTGVIDLEFAPGDPSTVYAAAWRCERRPWTIVSGGHQGRRVPVHRRRRRLDAPGRRPAPGGCWQGRPGRVGGRPQPALRADGGVGQPGRPLPFR